MRHTLFLACLGTSISVAAISNADAQEKNPTNTLDTVTVYATRTPTSTFEVPAMVMRVDADAPGAAMSSTTSDLLQFVPGVDVESGPRRNGQTVSVRGYDDEAIITLIDGRRQNFEAAHDGRYFIDPALLKSVEIVRGASSAVYGGGGVGGVVAFETKDANDMLAPGENTGALTSLGYRSANGEFAPLVSAYGRTGGLDVIGSLSYRRSGDIRLGDVSTQDNSSTLLTKDRVYSGFLKAGYTFADFHTVKVQYDHHRNDGSEPNNGGGSITTSNPTVDKKVRDDQVSFKYAYDNPENRWLSPSLHLYNNVTDVTETDISGSNAGRVQSRRINTLGFTLDNQTQLAEVKGVAQTLSYGFEIYTDKQEGRISTGSARPGVPDAEARAYGLYLQDEITVQSSIGKWLIVPAARFDSYHSEDNNAQSQDESQVSPKLSLSYLPNDNLMLFGSLAQAFRAPNMTELYPSGQHFPGNNFVSDPDLKPETVTTLELGAGYRSSDLVAKGDNARIKASVYRSEGKDFITQKVGTTTTTNLNIENAVLMGFEIEGEYRLNPITLKVGLSEVFAENDDTGEYLTNNTPLTFVGDVGYDVQSIDSTIGWRTRIADKSDRANSSMSRTDGYAVHDIYYRWRPSRGKLQNATLDLGVENLFDKAYSTRYGSLLEEGRSYVAKASMKW